MFTLDFEKHIVELEQQIQQLKSGPAAKKVNLEKAIKELEEKLDQARKEVYQRLTPWQRVQIARHPRRPYMLDYVQKCMTNFVELHGDRVFADDKALIGGFATLDGMKILVVGHQKGKDTKENLYRNFGSAHPEGYRKAIRLMQMAGKFRLPIVTFIDTPGAYPGIGAEERGQSQAIAWNLREMAVIPVPIICVVIGEGGSGGALGIGVGDRILVMENAYYSVISPEGCAAILWKDRAKAPEAAACLKLTAPDLLGLGIIDEAIPEPLGGAHRDPDAAAENVKAAIKRNLQELRNLPAEMLITQRAEKFRKIGLFYEV
ncbi:MAG: acetyl-CoA carboxylase carboxyltransferase subunit alpha [Candidatus Omnitrophica bacterium]|nr:acetyl-CoA carboxylase carboxyltransferase subunit alpha [Candidatus Omnitrophota bacterium]